MFQIASTFFENEAMNVRYRYGACK